MLTALQVFLSLGHMFKVDELNDMMALVDDDRSGEIEFDEFSALW